jgi:ketosteroid isomerase-like protein
MSMTNLEIVQALYEAFRHKDEPRIRQLLAANVEWIQCAGFPGGGRRKGVGEVLEKVFSGLRDEWSDWRSEIDEYLDAGSTIVALGRYAGTHGRTGRSMEAVFAHAWDLEGGQITRMRQFADTVPIARASQAATGEE